MGESFVFKMTLSGESEERLDKFNDFEAFVNRILIFSGITSLTPGLT